MVCLTLTLGPPTIKLLPRKHFCHQPPLKTGQYNGGGSSDKTNLNQTDRLWLDFAQTQDQAGHDSTDPSF